MTHTDPLAKKGISRYPDRTKPLTRFLLTLARPLHTIRKDFVEPFVQESVEREHMEDDVYTLKHLPNGDYEAAAPLDHLVAQAGTRAEAIDALKATEYALRFARTRLRIIRRATRISFDPRVQAYVARCRGVATQGFTRQGAWDALLSALRLADLARAAGPINLTEPTEEHGQVQEDRERGGLDCGGSDGAVPGRD